MALVINGAMIGFAVALYMFSIGWVGTLGALACYSAIGISIVLLQSAFAYTPRPTRS